jgi:hypothetical protein
MFRVSNDTSNKPLGRMTAEWQRLIGLSTAANEAANRVSWVIGGAIFLMLAIWLN